MTVAAAVTGVAERGPMALRTGAEPWLDAADPGGGEDEALGGCERRSVSILEMASASEPLSAGCDGVRGLSTGDLLGDLASGERERGERVAGTVDFGGGAAMSEVRAASKDNAERSGERSGQRIVRAQT